MFTVRSSKEDFPKNTGKKYKVIINAGGGLFGYIITNFMSYLDFDLYSKVDVVAGSSIGGILTLAYCCNNDYKWINKLFETGGPEIFDHINPLYLLSQPKYDNKNLKKFLHKIYGDLKLSDLKNLSDNDLKTIITTMDFTLVQPRVFENINLKKEQDISLVDLGLFTSAAPTYFAAHEYPWKMLNYDIDNIPLNEKILLLAARQQELIAHNKDLDRSSIIFDGGVLENIPVITTYTTLQNELGVEPKDIDMFVIGTGNFMDLCPYKVNDVNNWAIVDTALKLIVPYVTSSNEQTSVFWGLQMGFNSFTYFNPLNVTGDMDDAGILPGLKSKCERYKENFLEEIDKFLKR
jgi:patatin-like phospholipase/acyl hydrolase